MKAKGRIIKIVNQHHVELVLVEVLASGYLRRFIAFQLILLFYGRTYSIEADIV